MPTNKLYWKGFNDAKYGNYYLDSNWTKEELEEWTRGYKAYKKSEQPFRPAPKPAKKEKIR